MPANEIHVDDIGTQFIVTLKDGDAVVDVSSASTKQIWFHKPDGTVVQKTATFYTDGTDGTIYYTAESGDLDIQGSWKLQAFVIMGSTQYHSDITRFTVFPNLT